MKTHSNYDFVKVRVYLSDKDYYVLSRFLICRVLTSTLVEQRDAVEIALELKKHLVDSGQLELRQDELEAALFLIMQKRRPDRYGVDNISLYRTMSKFHHDRVPLVILLGGTHCCGKSTIATSLSERLNLTSVLATDMTFSCNILPLPDTCKSGSVIEDYRLRSETVQHCLQFDIIKCLREGKSLIVEGVSVGRFLVEAIRRETPHAVMAAFFLTINDIDGHRSMIFESDAQVLEHKLREYQLLQEYLRNALAPDFREQKLDDKAVETMHRAVLDTILHRT